MSNTAVVVGASVAGLAAARVLSDHYESVIVVERDELPDATASRRGVPQGPHSHVLVAAGLREFERLLPGFRADLIAAGGSAIDVGAEIYMSRYNRAWPSVPSDVEFVSVSRPMLELVLRERVAKLPPVLIRDGVAVTALTGTPDAVTGVLLASGEQVAAELVVDRTGRAGRSDRWMTDLGLPVPEQIDIKIGLGYATRLFQRGSDDLPGWKGIITLPDPPLESMVGVAFPIEGDRWLVSLIGWHIDELPGDDASFTAAARALLDPAIATLLDRVQPVTDPVTARLRSNHRRLFERLGRVPAGYAALGDAICSFNPFYGHGMTCAVQEAVALGTALQRHSHASAEMVRDYYQAAAVVTTPWQLAVDGDFAYPRPRARTRAVSLLAGTRSLRCGRQLGLPGPPGMVSEPASQPSRSPGQADRAGRFPASQCRVVDLAGVGNRQALDHGDRRRDHALRQPRRQMCAQAPQIQEFIDASTASRSDHVGGEIAPGPGSPEHHSDLGDAGVVSDRGLDLAGLDPVTPQLDLAVYPAQVFHYAIGPPPGEVAGAVQQGFVPGPVRLKVVGNGVPSGQPGPVQVSQGHTGAADGGRPRSRPGPGCRAVSTTYSRMF